MPVQADTAHSPVPISQLAAADPVAAQPAVGAGMLPGQGAAALLDEACRAGAGAWHGHPVSCSQTGCLSLSAGPGQAGRKTAEGQICCGLALVRTGQGLREECRLGLRWGPRDL